MRVSLLLITAGASAVLAQPVCPPVNFQVMSQVQVQDRPQSILSGLLRQADRSFTQLEITGNVGTKTSVEAGAVPNVQQNFFKCIGRTAKTPQAGPAPNLSVDPLGVGQRNTVITDLAGNGVGAIVGFDQRGAPGDVIAVTANAGYTLKSAATYPVGPTPMGVLAGDFNGDGKHDIAAVYFGPLNNSAPGGVTLLLGDGTGALHSAGNFPTDLNVTGATVWDFNKDGKDDIAVLNNGANTVTILLGNGNGTLTAGKSYNAGSNPGSIGVADFNGDNIPDLVMTGVGGTTTLFGNGDGTFSPGKTTAVTASQSFLGTGDFNKDGKQDVAVIDFFNSIMYILLGNGDGSFTRAQAYPTVYALGTYGNVGTFYVEDFDGDGNLDIVFAAGHPDALITLPYEQVIGVLFGNGDGTFSGAPTYTAPPNHAASIATADFNGDQKPDVAIAGDEGEVSVLIGQGGGVFKAGANLQVGAATQNAILPSTVAAGVLKTGGPVDLVASDGANGASVFIGNGDGTFQAPQSVPGTGSGTSFVLLGNFHNNQKLDMALANQTSNNLTLLPGNGDGSFGAGTTLPAGTGPVAIAAADFNKDGNLDLAVVNGGDVFTKDPGNLMIYLGKGNGVFATPVPYPAGMNPNSVTAADVNKDGAPDLIVTASTEGDSSNVIVFLGKGDGSFNAGVVYTSIFGASTVAAADFSGDGNVDLVAPHCCGDVATTYMLGNGDGTFQPEQQIAEGNDYSTVVADFNGDGKPDVALAGSAPSTGTVTIYLNLSAGAPQPVINHVISAGAYGGFPSIGVASWFEIYGTNLAIDSRQWASADFNGPIPPALLDGTSVQVNGVPASVYYINSMQVNALVPQQIPAGPASIVVTSQSVPSEAFPVQVSASQPAMLAPASFDVQGAQYVVAQLPDGTYVAPAGAIPGVTSRPAHAGETVTIYGVGFGAAENSAQQFAHLGQIASGQTTLASKFTVSIGGTTANASYDGLAPGYVGLYQFDIAIPSGPSGNAVPFTFTLNGSAGQQTLYTAVQ